MTAPYLTAAQELRGNKDQWSAFESTGNCVILAGPGSGKTKTVTIKIARILEEDLRCPQRVACLTYSNECVGELRRRLSKLEVDDSSRLLISTVHSFALTELVLPYAALAGLEIPLPFAVSSSDESNQLWKHAYLEVTGYTPRSGFKMPLEKLRRQCPDKSSVEWSSSNTQHKAIIERYESMLLDRRLIDFDGLVLAGLLLIKRHEWVRRCIKAKYPVIVIDEYQDLGVALDSMVLDLMRKAGVRILAVGDPDQSIYGFIGAKPHLLRRLAQQPGITSIRLRLNYRCANAIVSASQALLTEPAESESSDGRAGSIVIAKCEAGFPDQARHALSTVIPQLRNANPTWSPGDIAFLYRSYREGTMIADVANELGIQYYRADNGAPIQRTRLTLWLAEMAKWCSGGWRTGTVSLGQILRTWKLLRRSLQNSPEALKSRSALIAMLFKNRSGQMPLQTWLHALQTSVLEDMFENEPGLSDEKDVFASLLERTAAGRPLASYTVELFGNHGRSANQYNLMTLHSSKGLEFQAVIMLGLEAGVFPDSRATTEEERQEAARLFYVGVTRAKNFVYLAYAFDESPLVTAIRQVTEAES